MNRIRYCVTVMIIIACSLVLSGHVGAATDDSSKLVGRVRKTLDRLETFSCTFSSEQVWKELERTQHISGAITMKVGKKFKLRLERPGHIVVIDGATIWTYLPKHRQVQISDYVHNEEQFPSPHNIFKRYADEKTAKITGEEEINGVLCDIVSLASGEDSDVKVTVWIDRKLHFPVKAIEETTTGYVVTHVLDSVRINEKIDDDMFTFVIPDGVETVDMRE